ncbi:MULTISPECIES: hypothetical protein [unclassified Streptomyces]|uniref:Transposase n=1 Tax=Streptomyces niveiscabiei TaxID=164115 RepID=A0ABW9HI89_9ACTN|nr:MULTISPECIES: hypothetical protein [unclassified Streptomyces]QZZ28328.1 hypothetical protein A7X85_20465 [Streptomyces sp. ST1015]
MDAENWKQVNQLRQWLDDNDGCGGESERRLLRVLKIGEEFGEVSVRRAAAVSRGPGDPGGPRGRGLLIRTAP